MAPFIFVILLFQLAPAAPLKTTTPRYTLNQLPFPMQWGDYVWLSPSTLLISETDAKDTLHLFYWDPVKRIKTPLNYTWTNKEHTKRYTLSPNGKALVSRDLYGSVYANLRTGKIYTPRVTGYKWKIIRWFNQGERWLDLSHPSKSNVPLLLLCDQKRDMGCELISASPQHAVFNDKTEDILGVGKYIYALQLKTSVAMPRHGYENAPTTLAYHERYRLEERWKKEGKGDLKRYVAFQRRHRIAFPRMLHVKFATLSPNGQKAAWAFYEPFKPPNYDQRILCIGVSDIKTGKVVLVGRWKIALNDVTPAFYWMPDSMGFSFHINSKSYVVRRD
jgi:hypothetical protein